MDALAPFIVYLKHQRLLVDHMNICAFALLIYDYALTLHLEIKYIWLSKWGYTKVLFLLNRYTTFIAMFLYLYNQTFLNPSEAVCKVTWPASGWSFLVGTILAETILCLRTWAMWSRNKVVGILLGLTMATYVSVQCFLQNRSIRSLQASPLPYSGFRGCFLTSSASKSFLGQFLSLFLIELLILTLVVISGLRLYRIGLSSELAFIIHRDGILFYVYLLFLTTANIVIMVTAPLEVSMVLIPIQLALQMVFTARIVLNIRSVASGGLKAELHTSYFEAGVHLPAPIKTLPSERFPDRVELRSGSSHTEASSTMYNSAGTV